MTRLHHIAEVGKYCTVPVFIQVSRRVELGRLHLALGRCKIVLYIQIALSSPASHRHCGGKEIYGQRREED